MSQMSPSRSKAAFKASRISPNYFKIVEVNDIYNEQPFIYAKILPESIVVVDTGCGGATKDDVKVKSLREFLENWPIRENGGKPLNGDGRLKYVVICTHCHYDHILGVEQFLDSPILASSNSPSFVDRANLPTNSLCERLKISTPEYEPTLVDHLSIVKDSKGQFTGVQVLHTPGHTPDELALWDASDRILFVGDTTYEYAPIVFPPQGDITDWFKSIDFLLEFVENENRDTNAEKVSICSGHVTSMKDALDVLTRSRDFVADVVHSKEPIRKRYEMGGITVVVYGRDDRTLSLRCPESLIDKAREAMR